MFMIFLQAFSSIAGLSVHSAANRKYFDRGADDKQIASFIGACILILIISTLIFLSLIIINVEKLANILQITPLFIFYGVVSSSFLFLIQIILGQLQVRGRAVSFVIFQSLFAATNLFLSIYFIYNLVDQSHGRVIGILVSYILFGIIALLGLIKMNLLSFQINTKDIKEALTFGIPLIPHTLGFLMVAVFDRILISDKVGMEPLAVYLVAAQLAAGLNLIFESCNNAFMPWLFKRLKENNEKQLKEVVNFTYKCFLIFFIITCLSFIFSEPFIIFYAGPNYAIAGKILPWLLLGSIFVGMYFLVVNYIIYTKQNGFLAMATVSTGVLNLSLIYFFLDFYGLIGAAYATSLSLFLRFIIVWLIAIRKVKMPWLSSI